MKRFRGFVLCLAIIAAAGAVHPQPLPRSDERPAPAGSERVKLAAQLLFVRPYVDGVGTTAEKGRRIWHVYYDKNKTGKLDRETLRKEFTALLAALPAFEKIDASAVDPVETNGIRALGALMGTATRNTNGCLIGTLGVAAVDASGKTGYITCNHVAAAEGRMLCPDGSKANEVAVTQYPPSCTPTVSIGKLTKAPPEIKLMPTENIVDAAFVEERDAGVDPKNVCSICPNGMVTAPREGDPIQKCGAASRLTWGTIQSTDGYFRVTYNPCGITVQFKGQIVAEGAFAIAGDSGAVAFDRDGGAVGLVFAGDGVKYTLLNPFEDVRSLLGVTITKCK